MKTTIPFVLIAVALLCPAAAIPNAQAVSPPPDGGYPNFTTAEGQNALFNLTTGAANTAVGWFSLFGDTTASFNTGVGAGTLLFNNGDQNTAVGVAALLSNTTGEHNTALGAAALANNTLGDFNTASGVNALSSNTTGVSNTALGWGALLSNETGSNNTAIGVRAGENITGNSNICIGSQVSGVQGENSAIRIGDNLGGEARCFIGGIASTVMAGGYGVVVNPNENQLGIMASSARFKKDIVSMNKASEAIFSLNPVTFHYKSDDTSSPQFGLIAEDVARVNRALITVDQEGNPFSVRYEQINAMLLNEFIKEHRKVETLQASIRQLKSDATKQKATISELKKDVGVLTAQLKEQAAQIQKVSAQIEMSNVPRQVATRD